MTTFEGQNLRLQKKLSRSRKCMRRFIHGNSRPTDKKHRRRHKMWYRKVGRVYTKVRKLGGIFGCHSTISLFHNQVYQSHITAYLRKAQSALAKRQANIGIHFTAHITRDEQGNFRIENTTNRQGIDARNQPTEDQSGGPTG